MFIVIVPKNQQVFNIQFELFYFENLTHSRINFLFLIFVRQFEPSCLLVIVFGHGDRPRYPFSITISVQNLIGLTLLAVPSCLPRDSTVVWGFPRHRALFRFFPFLWSFVQSSARTGQSTALRTFGQRRLTVRLVLL